MSSITDPMTTASALEPGTKAPDFRLPSTSDYGPSSENSLGSTGRS